MGKLKNKRKRKKYRNDNPTRTISFEEIVKGIALCAFAILFIKSLFNILCVPANRYILIPIVDEYGKLATATISDMYKETYYGRRAQNKVTNEVREYVFTCEGDVYYGKLKGEKFKKYCKNLQIGDSLDILYMEKFPYLNASICEIEALQ
ncbi:MAG: hypothetical protein IJY54_06300 [Paludibacteraceae bacterium]|nr:hypothetical protein [Paludibacteraceae bacterium]